MLIRPFVVRVVGSYQNILSIQEPSPLVFESRIFGDLRFWPKGIPKCLFVRRKAGRRPENFGILRVLKRRFLRGNRLESGSEMVQI